MRVTYTVNIFIKTMLNYVWLFFVYFDTSNMISALLKYLISLVILLHCMGATQLASALAKDKSAFIGMLNMTEEETKKEKESKEDNDDSKTIVGKPLVTSLQYTLKGKRFFYTRFAPCLFQQFVIELPTPPPDSRA